jgi:lipoprotein-anchoring transpeptidase ErfK/SrfK
LISNIISLDDAKFSLISIEFMSFSLISFQQFLQLLRFPLRSFASFTLLSTALILSGCASYDSRLNSSATQYLGTDGSIVTRASNLAVTERESYWEGDTSNASPSIVINISEQKVYYYKGGKLVGISSCSTGKEGHASPVGKFKVQIKDEKHASNLYGDFVDALGVIVVKNVDFKKDKPPAGAHFQGSSMPWFMGFAPGVGMHTGFLPGVPDSHGCIRLPDKMAKIFFANTPKGTPVTVLP